MSRVPYPVPLRPGTLVRRYKRFLADVEVDGQVVVAHCPNPGAMTGMTEPGTPVYVSHDASPRRKLPWTLELVQHGGTWVGIHTLRPNPLVAAWYQSGELSGLGKPDRVEREVSVGASRLDLVGWHGDSPCYVEIKNTTLLRRPGLAEFPDARSIRAAKHMRELQQLAEAGHDAAVVFLVHRGDATRFAVAADVDPDYHVALVAAESAGVRVLPVGVDVGPDGWRLRGLLRRA